MPLVAVPFFSMPLQPAKAVPVCHLIAHGECHVANLISHILEEREHLRPVLQFRLYPDMLQRRLDVEGHDVRCVKLLQSLKILGPDSFDNLLDLPANRGFVYLALRRHRFSSRLSRVESWLPARVKTTQHPGMSGPGASGTGAVFASGPFPGPRPPNRTCMRFSRTPLTGVLHSRRPACPSQSRKDLGAMTMAIASAQALSPDTRQRTRNVTRSVTRFSHSRPTLSMSSGLVAGWQVRSEVPDLRVLYAVIPVFSTLAYSGARQAAYATPPFPAPTPPGAPLVKALRARLDVLQPSHG